jgi:hypothetical protein
MPINFDMGNGKSAVSSNNNNSSSLAVPENVLPRPHTAPSFTEMFRPQSALDIPELSEVNLRNMLK